MPDVVLCHVPDHEQALAAGVPDAAVLAEPFSGKLARSHPDTRILSVMIHDSVDADALQALPRLEAVITRSDGHDHLPLEWMRRQGIAAYNLGDYATESVAELAMMFLVALARRVPEATHETRGGGWDRTGLVGHRLSERTVGIVGVGRIGGRLAQMLTSLGVEVVGYDIDPDPAWRDLPGFHYAEDLSALVEQADALSLHVPLTADTHHLVDGDLLGRVQPGTILVNTARGAIVDTHAVHEALETGALAGFAADVLPDEPDVPEIHLLQDDPRVMLTPHLGAHNHATIEQRYQTTGRIVRAVLAGQAEDVAAYLVA